jgi:hypothetical protein
MKRRTRISLCLTAALALFALAGAAQAATAGKLLVKYQPVTYFTADEAFRPTSINDFVADSTLERVDPADGTVTVVDPDPDLGTLPASGANLRLNQQPCSPALGLAGEACYAAASAAEDAGSVYGRVVRSGGKLVLQYWYFYYDDFYSYTPTVSDFIWQAHEGDWEVVNVVLSGDEQPLYVGYSQHCLGERRTWTDTTRWGSNHPVVYVARGSHANYLDQGVHAWNRACLPTDVIAFFNAAGLPLPNDYTSDAAAAGPASLDEEVTGIRRVTATTPTWMQFPGTWGELQYLHAPAPVGTIASGFSPVGPAQHGVWGDPLGTLATWPAS